MTEGEGGRWTCPRCGKEYEVPPKWCPCEPYRAGTASTSWYLARLKEDADLGTFLDAIQPVGDLFCDELVTITGEDHLRFGEAAGRRPGRRRRTRYLLVREDHEPHVETLDEYGKAVVFLGEDEYEGFKRSLQQGP